MRMPRIRQTAAVERTLVLGAGFGGIAVATGLRDRLGDSHEVTLVDRSASFSMGLRKLWELVELGTIEHGSRPRAALAGGGIEVVEATVTAIDPVAREAETTAGRLEADRLVVALGAEPRPDLVSGLAEHGHPIWVGDAVPAARDALTALRSGRVAVVIFGAPYPCPPAPYECVMLVDDYLRARELRGAIELEVVTLQPLLLPNAGQSGSEWLAARLDERGIGWRVEEKAERVEEGRVVFELGGELVFDLLLAVPPHRAPSVVVEAGLTAESGWIEPDRGTFATTYPGVWAIGDCTFVRLANGLPLPKAGVMAAAQGDRVAAAIAAEISGLSRPATFDGRGYCFVETGLREAALIDGDFYADPEPAITLREPSPAHHDAKVGFELEHLVRWFG
jgi:sulfide:quinone oxidoreductase